MTTFGTLLLAAALLPTSHITEFKPDWILRANAQLPAELRLTRAEADAAIAAREAARKAVGFEDRMPYRCWHSFKRWTKGEIWKNHRDWFGLLPNGTRGVELPDFPPWMATCSKICVSNEEVLEQRLAEWQAAGRPEVLEAAEDDGLLGYCRCANCRALDADLPGERFLVNKTDRYLDFWNRLAAKARAIRPDVKVAVYLYSVLRHPPRREKVAFPDNMLFIYVPTFLDDAVAEIRAWKKAGLRHFILRPNYLASTSALPIAREKYVCEQHAALCAEGAAGDYFDVIPGVPATEFDRYAATRLCADPAVDFATVERDWCARFGDAAETVRAYYARVRARCDRNWRAILDRQRAEGDEFLDDGHYFVRATALHALPELEADVRALEAFDSARLTGEAARNFTRLLVNARHYPLVYRALVTRGDAEKAALTSYRIRHKADLGTAWAEYLKKSEYTLWNDTPAKHRYESLASTRVAERFENNLARSDPAHRGPLARTDDDRVETPLAVPFRRLATLRPRAVSETGDSNWTVGCETIERGYADFWEYADYLSPLGIRTIRVQAGWARCESQPGQFDFAWLDDVIEFARAQGLNVLLETSYGNPCYPGAGGWDLGAGFPTSAEGLAAWDRWVRVLATRYRNRVRDWAMWNEPDIRNPASPTDAGEKKPEDIAAFNVRTARIIRSVIPDARLAGLSLARIHDPDFFARCIRAMGENAKLFTWFIHHGYAEAPEESYGHLDRLTAILRENGITAPLRQGENGCPSEFAARFALRGIAWSEYSQAKWDLRRMLGDLAHGFESSVFTICDFNHTGREINRKGLLRATDDHKVVAVKRAYYAVQNLASVFDAALARVATPTVTNVDQTVILNEYRRGGHPLYVFWTHAEFIPRDIHTYKSWLEKVYLRPSDSFQTRPTVLTASAAPLRNPVWVDLLTGRVYAFPPDRVHPLGARTVYTDVPVYDSPCLLTERAALDAR